MQGLPSDSVVEVSYRKDRKGLPKAAGKAKGKKKPVTISKLQKEADRVMSLYVRLSGADSEGICTCYTCGYRAHYKKMQNGHYISRFYKSRRYDLRNTAIQCAMCNMWKNGDIPTFRANLVRDLGAEVVSELETGYKDVTKLSRELYLERISYFTNKLALLSEGE